MLDLSKTYQTITIWTPKSSPKYQNEPSNWDIYHDLWSNWKTDINTISFKGIHSIRDPRSLIYSATLYHLRGTEQWLHRPNKKFNEKSYFEMINSYSTLEDQVEFEMTNASFRTIKTMYRLFSDKRFFHIKLEDISFDPKMTSLKDSFKFCNIEPNKIYEWLEIASNHCLWKMGKLPNHATTGMSDNWKGIFTVKLLKKYNELFNYIEKELGYISNL